MSVEPRIRYARTSDGVSIAYYDEGQGAPLLVLPTIPWSNIQAEFSGESIRFHPRLASEHRLIHYDVRGAGLSQRGVVDFSLAALQLDLDAVIGRLDVDRINLYAEWNAAKVALAFAATHPERVDRIILWAGFADGRESSALPRMKAVQSLFDQTDWELYTETVAQVVFGLAGGEPARQYAAYMRDCVTREEAGVYFAADQHEDVTGLLGQVAAPTLLLHPAKAPLVAPVAWGRAMASSMPDAHLKLFDTNLMWSQEIEDWLVESIRDFLRDADGDEEAIAPRSRQARAFRTVLFTDLVGHTEMMQRLGDAKGRAVLREHERITRETLKTHGGAEVKTMGDGFMASFGSVTSAMECAIALQRAFAQHTESMPEPLHVRVGLNAGEPIEEDGDLFGSTVILASRIAAKAGAGEILVPDTVRGLLSGKGFVFGDRGEFVPKGFDEGVRLWDVQWRQ